MNDFTFDDETKDVLKTRSKKQGRPSKSTSQKKTKCVNCYLTEKEYKQFMGYLEDRPASTFLRKYILQKIGR